MILIGTQLRFLVVDDDNDRCSTTANVIERIGHFADQADGVEAIEALAFGRYDFMLVDVTVPRRSGEDVLRWLRAHPEWAVGMKVVVVVSGPIAGSAGRPESLGNHVAIPKPSGTQQWRDLVGASLASTAV